MLQLHLVTVVFQQNAEVQSFLQGLASVGTEILYTCRENKMQCNQIVNL